MAQGAPASEPVRVLALIDHFALGGAQTLLARFALAAARAEIQLSLACMSELEGNPAAAPLRAMGIDPFNLDVTGRPEVGDLLRMRRHIARVRPQIVHTHLGTSDLVGGLSARSLGVPVVSTIHAMDWGSPSPGFHVKRMLVRSFCARIVAVSEEARRRYLERHWASERQIVTIHNGVDAVPEPGSGAQVRRELGLEPDGFVVGMVSGLRPEKAHDVAIQAVAMLRARFPQLRLLIVGQGHLRDEIERQATALERAAVIVGGRPDVMRVFDAIDLCLHPSRADAFPTTLLEAMAAGVPVLASAVGGIPEIVEDSRTGVLVSAPPEPDVVAGELAKLIEDPGRRAALAEAAVEVYRERFTAGPWISRTRALYDEVLSLQRRGSSRPRRSAPVRQTRGERSGRR